MDPRRLQVPLLVFMIFVCGFTTLAHGQATPTADQRFRIKAFGLLSYVRPEYGGAKKNAGGTIGGNFDVTRLLSHLDVGLDVRYLASGGRVSNQNLFSGGPRVSYNVYRVRPYVDFLVGRGRIIFNQPFDPIYTKDTSTVQEFGGGADVQVTRSWSLRADVQEQRWKLSTHTPYFHPLAVSVGVAYQLHFHSKYGPQ